MIEKIVDQQSWNNKKLRGFKRKSVAFSEDNRNISQNVDDAQDSVIKSSEPTIDQIEDQHGQSQGTQKRRYCHFFVNNGKCNYEEKTGSKCKFLHEKAPMCNAGIRCSRQRCMYSHPKMNTIQNFLAGPMKNHPGDSVPIPWQMINWNPWNTPNPMNQHTMTINPWQKPWNQHQ